MAFSPGERFDRYTIEGVLGEGGMGRVYRAFDPRLGRRVALKVLSVAVAASDEAQSEGRARILREAQAAAALDHPNVVAIFEVGEIEGTPYITMELVSGRLLRERILDPSVALDLKMGWLKDVARALAAAHARGLIHRDIKPDNVMVREDGVVKVLDFGVARRTERVVDPTASTEAVGSVDSVTADGGIVGTPMYMAPEQLHGERVDARADQFAWGVLAYETLTGKLPWDMGRGVFALARAIANDAPPPLAEVVSGLDPRIAAVVHRALEKSKERRFGSMDDLLVALGLSSSAAQVLPVPRRSNRFGVIAAAGALIVAGGAAVAVGLAVRHTPSSSEPAETTPPVSAPPSSAGRVTVMDQKFPESPHDDANAAYRSGMQAFQDGSYSEASQGFAKAIERDPNMAAAHLRDAEMAWIYLQIEHARSEFARASALRSALIPREKVILDMLEITLGAQPRLDEAHKLIDDAIAEHPGDAELLLLRATISLQQGHTPLAVRDATAALDIDPLFGGAWMYRVWSRAEDGQPEDAIAQASECLRRVPRASSCAGDRATLLGQLGRCAELDEAGQEIMTKWPISTNAPGLRANALAALGKLDATKQILLQRRERLRPENRAEQESLDAGRLSLLAGDFVTAEARLREVDAARASSEIADAHSMISTLRVAVAEEVGHTKDAGDIAMAFLGARDAWTLDDPSADATPLMLRVARTTGRLSAEEWKRRRDTWFGSQIRTPRAASVAWFSGYALPADTAADGEEAALAFTEQNAWLWSQESQLPIGKAFLLAGKIDQAVPPLRRAAGSCFILADPLSAVRAHYFLGRALEAKRDLAGACTEYGAVVARWGQAKPGSTTADAAKARIKAVCR